MRSSLRWREFVTYVRGSQASKEEVKYKLASCLLVHVYIVRRSLRNANATTTVASFSTTNRSTVVEQIPMPLSLNKNVGISYRCNGDEEIPFVL